MFRSNFTPTGLDLSQSKNNLSYLYGLSDFWSTIFEDSSQIDTLLEATTFQLSEIYSRFLQLTSTLSLVDIQTTVDAQLKLVLLSESDQVPGKTNTYKLPETILGANYVANRPFAPTLVLEDGVHFRLSSDGSEVTFYADIAQLPFPTRKLPSGESQLSLWMSDVNVDEGLISKYYADLIQVTPESSTELFKQYIQGLYYVYTQGPILETIRRGLNLVIGIPLSRAQEKVISISQYPETNNWMVVTASNTYVIPYGLVPTVNVGDTLTVGQEIAQWVEIKDYEEDGEWWINYSIPVSVIPELPAGEVDRFATKGSYADFLMSTYLKTHTFLVNIRVADFQNVQIFNNLTDIIRTIKPSYTLPVYVWSVEVPAESLQMDDSVLTRRNDVFYSEALTAEPYTFKRSVIKTPYTRGYPQFIRFNAPDLVDYWMGRDQIYQGYDRSFSGVTIDGYVGTQAQHYVTQDLSYSESTYEDFIGTLIQENPSSTGSSVTGVIPTQEITITTPNLSNYSLLPSSALPGDKLVVDTLTQAGATITVDSSGLAKFDYSQVVGGIPSSDSFGSAYYDSFSGTQYPSQAFSLSKTRREIGFYFYQGKLRPEATSGSYVVTSQDFSSYYGTSPGTQTITLATPSSSGFTLAPPSAISGDRLTVDTQTQAGAIITVDTSGLAKFDYTAVAGGLPIQDYFECSYYDSYSGVQYPAQIFSVANTGVQTRFLGEFDVSQVSLVKDSQVSWSPIDLGPKIEASLDGGVTWTPVTAPGTIPGLSQGVSTTGMSLIFRQTFSESKGNYLSSFSFDVATDASYYDSSDNYAPWIRTLFRRDQALGNVKRSSVSPVRNLPLDQGVGETKVDIPLRSPFSFTSPDSRDPGESFNSEYFTSGSMVPLYVTKKWDILAKLVTLGKKPLVFDQFVLEDVNTQLNYDALFFRNSLVGYLGVEIPDQTGYRTFAPSLSQLSGSESLFVTRIVNDIFAVYWIKTSPDAGSDPYWTFEGSDKLSIQTTRSLSRTGLTSGFQVYSARGALTSVTNQREQGGVINARALAENSYYPVETITYTDAENPQGVVLKRDGSMRASFKREV